MKKILTILFAVATTMVMAADSYLYWMVDEPLSGYAGTWDAARIAESGSDTYLTLYNGDSGVAIGDTATSSQALGGLYAALGSTPASTYLVELLWGDVAVANGELSGLTSYITPSPTFTPVSTPALIGSFTATGAVPEPTSGMLLLLGGALLGLRRRRRIV